MRVFGVAMAAVLISGLAAGGLGLGSYVLQRLPEPIRVTFAGRAPARDPSNPSRSRWLEQQADREGRTEVRLLHPDGVLLATRASLGLVLDTEAWVRELTRPPAPLGTVARLRLALGGAPPAPIDFAPAFRLDSRRAEAWLSDIAAGLRRDPIDARLDLEAHQRVEAQPGRELDWGTSLARLAALGAREEVELAFTAIPPKVSSAALGNLDPSITLSEYETDFAKRGGPRVRNIARAARYLDGTILAPGEIWSFNRSVGPRTLGRGFVDAPVIVADELEPGVGGGVCQVATTLFAASVLGGLDIVERRSHSRPSGYAPLGLDATVIDGEVDLRLRNPYDLPLIVHAHLPQPTRLRVELLGARAPGKVEHSYSVVKSEDFFRRVTTHPEMGPDQIRRRQKGIPGYDVISTVRTRYPDGSERARRYSSTYYPVPEIYWVGSRVDPASLPPLPDRATHTELQTEAPAVTPVSYTSNAN